MSKTAKYAYKGLNTYPDIMSKCIGKAIGPQND